MEVARKYLNESATILIRPEETAFNSSAETGM
jgi:hypothetical protein